MADVYFRIISPLLRRDVRCGAGGGECWEFNVNTMNRQSATAKEGECVTDKGRVPQAFATEWFSYNEWQKRMEKTSEINYRSFANLFN